MGADGGDLFEGVFDHGFSDGFFEERGLGRRVDVVICMGFIGDEKDAKSVSFFVDFDVFQFLFLEHEVEKGEPVAFELLLVAEGAKVVHLDLDHFIFPPLAA